MRKLMKLFVSLVAYGSSYAIPFLVYLVSGVEVQVAFLEFKYTFDLLLAACLLGVAQLGITNQYKELHNSSPFAYSHLLFGTAIVWLCFSPILAASILFGAFFMYLRISSLNNNDVITYQLSWLFFNLLLFSSISILKDPTAAYVITAGTSFLVLLLICRPKFEFRGNWLRYTKFILRSPVASIPSLLVLLTPFLIFKMVGEIVQDADVLAQFGLIITTYMGLLAVPNVFGANLVVFIREHFTGEAEIARSTAVYISTALVLAWVSIAFDYLFMAAIIAVGLLVATRCWNVLLQVRTQFTKLIMIELIRLVAVVLCVYFYKTLTAYSLITALVVAELLQCSIMMIIVWVSKSFSISRQGRIYEV